MFNIEFFYSFQGVSTFHLERGLAETGWTFHIGSISFCPQGQILPYQKLDL